MGIFDSYFDPQSYGSNTGILGLIESLQQQGQYQNPQGPGFGTPANPLSFGQTRNVDVGGYSMPQFGNAPQSNPMDANAQMQPAPQAAPPSPEMTMGDRGMAGFQGFANNLQAGPIGALIGGIGGLVSGQSANPQAATVQSLVSIGVPQAQASAVVRSGNPELLKFVMERYAKTNYGFQTLPDGTVVRQDPTRGTVEPVYAGNTKPTWGVIGKNADGKEQYGFINTGARTVQPYQAPGAEDVATSVAGPDGKPIAIPPGVDRATFVKEVSRANAKAAAGEKTEVQAKSEKFGNKMENAEKNLRGLEGEGGSYIGRALEGAPIIGGTMATNWAQSDNYQKYKQARDNFITALLRDESGAAIGTEEFKRYERELFPQPGEGPAVVAQKAEARRIAIEAMKKSAGPGYKSPTEATPGKTKTNITWSVE